eukprot:6202623-Pleurochrysis_carterae.AAC.4
MTLANARSAHCILLLAAGFESLLETCTSYPIATAFSSTAWAVPLGPLRLKASPTQAVARGSSFHQRRVDCSSFGVRLEPIERYISAVRRLSEKRKLPHDPNGKLSVFLTTEVRARATSLLAYACCTTV